jgi:hypothetical protein
VEFAYGISLITERAGVAQWQSPSLPSWPCEFDSRHPLHGESPSQWGDRSANVSRALRNPGVTGH